ncbi:MAG: exo-alpha-sialidase [Rubripirellula sp.]
MYRTISLFTVVILFAFIGSVRGQSGNRSKETFESSSKGLFERYESGFGIWKREVGEVAIDPAHAKSGTSCLHLRGGEESVVVVGFTEPIQSDRLLRFWAERWTSRSPFSFRIEKEVGGNWEEVFNGDASVRVGRAFLNDVKVSLGAGPITALRFRCSSPAATGILIDDMQITPLQPQRVVAVEQAPFTLPALLGKQSAPLGKLKITVEGNLKPLELHSVKAKLLASVPHSALTGMFVGTRPGGELPSDAELIAVESLESSVKDPVIDLPAGHALVEGDNEFWINGFLSDELELDDRVGAQLISAVIGAPIGDAGEDTIDAQERTTHSVAKDPMLGEADLTQRLGVALREGGDDGVHTYRIPGLVTTNAGTLIAVYDIRHRGGGDLPNDIDIGMSRSTDGGRTWEPMRAIMDMGRDPNWRYDGIGDPAVLVDQQTGTIWVAATWSHGNRSWNGSGPGMTPEQTGQVMLVRSDDDGRTWSKPINITSQVKDPNWCFVLPGPGRGITMQDGTLVFAAQYQDPPERRRLPHSTILYSKDQGETWQIGTGAWDDTTESQVVEIEPGVLMLNCRYNRKDRRVVMITRDMGETWEKHVTSERSLIEPRACMASLIRPFGINDASKGDWLLFSNPDSIRRRERLMIKASTDQGLNWLADQRVLLDEGVSAGYSCMTMVDSKHVGILYEGSQSHLTFQRVPIAELFGTGSSDQADHAVLDSERSDAAKNVFDSRVQADALSLPMIFSDHMVLQAAKPLPVWGKARPGCSVTVSLDGDSQSATADEKGRWRVTLAPKPVDGKTHTLRVQAAEEMVELQDVVLGEVWVCAGQSNMEWPLVQTTNGADEIAKADQTKIRLMHLRPRASGGATPYSAEQLLDLQAERYYRGSWQRSDPDAAKHFSAVGWYFGRHLQQELQVPIGLISLAVGGSPIESWIAFEQLAGHERLSDLVSGNWLDNPLLGDFCRSRGEQNLLGAMSQGDRVLFDVHGPRHPFQPGFLWSAGIDRIIPFAVQGVIWYQGESNAETAVRVAQNEQLFSLLVNSWRQAWSNGFKADVSMFDGNAASESGWWSSSPSLPFYVVQLPAMDREHWPLFRDSQRRLANELEKVELAVTLDTGHRTNVHPPLKKPVGERLADLALYQNYQKVSKVDAVGPTVASVEQKGSAWLLTFDHCDGGVMVRDGDALKHFEFEDASGDVFKADAKVIGTNVVKISCGEKLSPTAVRYAWMPYPEPPVNFFNAAGYPASPFRLHLKNNLVTSSAATSQ